jgi:hypothetical protein
VTPAEFIAKWQASTRNERAACQEHFIGLCRLLDEPTPNSDPTGLRLREAPRSWVVTSLHE